MKKITSKLLLGITLCFASSVMLSQVCVQPPTSNKYGNQSTYIPTANDPVIKVNITIHVFNHSDGIGGNWRDDPPNGTVWNGRAAILGGNYLGAITGPLGSARRSVQRQATYPDPAGFSVSYINDSRIEYYVTNVYYYNNTVLCNGNPYANLTPYLAAMYNAPGNRLEEGLPIIINDGSSTAFTTGYSYQNSSGIVVCSPVPPSDPTWFKNNILHETGHAFGLYHPYWGVYYPPGSPNASTMIPTPETTNCSDLNWLSDLLPANNTGICGPGVPGSFNPPAPCTACYEFNGVGTNNIMSDFNTLSPREWMSPLQMGRRIRNMHVIAPGGTGSVIRKYARDAVSQHTFPWLITTNETWNFDIQMYRDIVVKAGATLRIQCKVAMAIEGKIQVEKGAQLIIESGGEVTGWCKTGLWGSIQVAGDPSQNQSINATTGYAANQGVLRVITGGKITHAGTGITNYLTDVNNNIDWSSMGGIVLANGAVFENNSRTAEFITYPNFLSASKFENCNFKISGAIGMAQPNVPALPFAQVSIWDVKGIQFKGCKFEYAAGTMYQPSDRGMGIYSIDAQYSVDKLGSTATQFINLNTGIRIGNFNPLRTVNIANCEFNKNVLDGVHIENMHSFVLEKNKFTTPGNGSSCGLYMDKCRYYNVRNNDFEQSNTTAQSDIGIYIFDSQDGAHEIYRNTFQNLFIGICPQGNNSGDQNYSDGLRINCNNFAVGSVNQYDIAMLDVNAAFATASIWQSNFNNTDPLGLVRNIYSASPICGNCENRWYIDNNGVKQMFHYNHGNANTKITPQPAYSDPSIIAVDINWMSMDYVNHCPETQNKLSAVHANTAADLNYHISELRADNSDGHNDQNIRGAVAEKMNFFLTDTIYNNPDSVVNILATNQIESENADVLTAYAYMHKRDDSHAATAISAISTTKNDWKLVLEKLLYLQQHPADAYNVSSTSALGSFFNTYATTDGIDGQGSAKAVMEFGTRSFYPVPRLLPSGTAARNVNSIMQRQSDAFSVSAYPNPVNGLLKVAYKNQEDTELKITLTDALGRKVYEGLIKPSTELDIPMQQMQSGVYILNAYNNGGSVYQTKIMCIK